ncbi:hypothetical protein [Flavobacterium sp.]|uniref:hypothetical protein n=1 Tax=Flavobacterium sp. TaxID=239 RepID=UPI002632EA4D|nr:hypothetical protein [Flavobacterium sp.]
MIKKQIISILFTLVSSFAFAQFAMIIDKDGYVNVRKEGKIANNIVDKLKNGTIVYALEPASANWDWTTIIYDEEKTGVVAFDRIKFIADYSEVKKIVQKSNQLVLKNTFFEISIQSKKFDTKNQKIEKNKQGNIIKINSKNIYGTDGTVPNTQYSSITILHDNKKINFQKSEYENLYNPDLENTRAYFNAKENTLYLEAVNSDGAGYYTVVFVFKNEKFIEKKIVIPF